MRIAVAYEYGEVFQHFGHTEQFKIYETENNEVVSSEIVATAGSGHGALASFLADQHVDVLLCGGIGGGAQTALEEAGIQLCAGASGNADEAVAAFLRGELVDTGANCDHHSDGGSCGDSCHEHEGGCHDGCEGCHAHPMITGKNAGKKCRTHYRGTFNDGTQFDSSYDRGEPLEFICGAGMMIPGFDAAVADMDVGQIVQVHLMPEEAYGEADPDAIFTVETALLPGSEKLAVGEKATLQNTYGQSFLVTVTEKTDTTITFDANHEMAGKELNFTIELVDVSEA